MWLPLLVSSGRLCQQDNQQGRMKDLRPAGMLEPKFNYHLSVGQKQKLTKHIIRLVGEALRLKHALGSKSSNKQRLSQNNTN